MLEVPEFHIGQRKPPPLFPDYQDYSAMPFLEQCFKIDVIWSLLDELPNSAETSVPIGLGQHLRRRLHHSRSESLMFVNIMSANIFLIGSLI